MWRRNLYVYRYPDGGDGAGAGGAGAAGAGNGGAGGGGNGGQSAGGGASAGAGAGAGDKGSLLSAAGGAASAGAAAAAAAAADPNAWLPEKFRVFDGEGDGKKLNVEASAKKLAAEGYSPLEKRLGDGGAPPEKPEGYKTDNVVTALKAKANGQDVKLPEGVVKEFNQWAHDAKLTQAQYDKALVSYMGGIQKMVDTAFDNAMTNAQAELTKVWGADAADPKSRPMQAAYKAYMTYAPKDLRTPEGMDKVGNNAIVMQILAAVGAEMGEDKRTGGEGAGGEDVNALMKTQAYWDKKHPEHAATVTKVNQFFAGGGKVQQRQAAG